MKKLLSLSAVMLLAAVYLTGCSKDISSPTGMPDPMSAKGRAQAPVMSLVWVGASGSGTDAQAYKSAIYMADSAFSTGTHLVEVAQANKYVMYYNGLVGWSPTGGSICLVQKGVGSVPDSIKAFDVSLSTAKGNSNGNPVSSNERTIIGFPNTNSQIRHAYWSSTTSMGKIAYTTIDANSFSLCVISQSGGTPTTIATATHSLVFPTWNSDDSRLAVVRNDSTAGSATIMIFNTSTGAYVDSITVSGIINGLEWSRSGMNKLAFSLFTSGTNKIYFCDPTTGATPATSGVTGNMPTWSPNNSSIMYLNNGLYKNVPFTTSVSSVIGLAATSVKWKR